MVEYINGGINPFRFAPGRGFESRPMKLENLANEYKKRFIIDLFKGRFFNRKFMRTFTRNVFSTDA